MHTPMAIARFGVGRVHRWLQDAFGFELGLGDPRVALLDPAVGTGVWLSAALEYAVKAAGPRDWLALDVDAAALATSQRLLASECEASGTRLHVRCDNTLALASPWLERQQGVRVIVGNPPWAARSLTRGTQLSDAWLSEFRRELDGSPLRERRTGVLSDDYVRFFRWALEQVRTAPAGAILCFATNHSFVDGPVHRSMRAALSSAFDCIELLDLGGNSLLSRHGARDENVFGVRVGAALTLGVRLPGSAPRQAELRIASVQGSREQKLLQLTSTSFSTLPAMALGAPWVQRHARRPARESLSLAEIFPFHREGVQTNRDELAIAQNEAELIARLEAIAEARIPLAQTRHFDPAQARRALERMLSGERATWIRKLAYRPLDTRVFCALPPLCHRPRPDLLRAMEHSSLCLLSVRKDRGDAPFNLFAAAQAVSDSCFLSTRSSCRTRVFPSHTPEGKPNLSVVAEERLGKVAAGTLHPELGVAYVLGVLSAASYRAEQGEALKLDYAAIPLPPEASAMAAMAQAGQVFIDALTVVQPGLGTAAVRACVPGSRILVPAELTFSPERGEIAWASEVVFEGVSVEMWECCVGQVHLWRSRARASRSAPMSVEVVLCRLRCAEQIVRARQLADRSFREHFL